MKIFPVGLGLIVLIATGAPLCVFAQQTEAGAEDEPLRLEATIRGNKEQPSVLSIVPWQLPKHRTIDGALQWQPSLSKPVVIERTRFLRRLALMESLQMKPVSDQ